MHGVIKSFSASAQDFPCSPFPADFQLAVHVPGGRAATATGLITNRLMRWVMHLPSSVAGRCTHIVLLIPLFALPNHLCSTPFSMFPPSHLFSWVSCPDPLPHTGFGFSRPWCWHIGGASGGDDKLPVSLIFLPPALGDELQGQGVPAGPPGVRRKLQ